MRFRSTPDSIARGEPTVLAAVECVLSVVVYGMIAVYWQTIAHIAVAVACAPLFLLRTRYSTARALKQWELHWARLLCPDSTSLANDNPFSVLLDGLTFRVEATVVGFIKFPRQTIISIPGNWFRQSLCTDFFFPPEIVPGESRSPIAISTGRIIMLGGEVRDRQRYGLLARWAYFLGATWYALICYPPALLLRISFKATCIAYVPLIFIARSAQASRESPTWRLERFKSGAPEKYRRILAGLVLVTLVGKEAVFRVIINPPSIEQIISSAKYAGWFVEHLSWWQISLAFDALVTFIIFLYADAALAKIKAGRADVGGRAVTVVNILSFLRGLSAGVAVFFAFVGALLTVAGPRFE